MGQSGFAGSSAIQAWFGWIQSLFNGVWSLFSGGSGGSLLKWLSNNWLSLLVFFLALGLFLDMFIYLLRWKPYWWWFGKKRLIIDDEVFEKDPAKVKRKAPPSKASKKTAPSKVKPSTYIPKRETGSKTNDDFLFEDESVFSLKPQKKKDVFEVNRSAKKRK